MAERIAAVIGIGSNSVRMLTAQISGDTGVRLGRERAATRLFAGLDTQRRLSRESMATTAGAAGEMAARARARGAEALTVFATSATRDAVNADEFAALIREKTGADLLVCSGDEEAALSFIGASDGGDCGVIDIGGGSTEVVLGEGMQVRSAVSCQMGAVRLNRLIAIDSPADLPGAIQAAAGVLDDTLAGQKAWRAPACWRGTGGTFTCLSALVRDVDWTDRTVMHGTRLTRAAVWEQAHRLAALTVPQRMEIHSLQPSRADIVVHGICILLACMERLDIPEITVSEYGNLDGMMKRTYGLKSLITLPLPR